MPREEYVVRMSTTSDMYLQNDVTSWESATWGSPGTALTFETLVEAQERAAAIGGGTVGTTKPS